MAEATNEAVNLDAAVEAAAASPPATEPVETAAASPAITDEDIREEIRTFVLHEQTVTTIEGASVPVPKCTYGKQYRITSILGEMFEGVVRESNLAEAFDAMKITLTILGLLLSRAPERAGEILGILLVENQKDRGPTDEEVAEKVNWVHGNLDMGEVLTIVVPFLESQGESIARAVGPVFQTLVREAVATQLRPTR